LPSLSMTSQVIEIGVPTSTAVTEEVHFLPEPTSKHHWFDWGHHEEAAPIAVPTSQSVVDSITPVTSHTTIEVVQPTTASGEGLDPSISRGNHGWFHWGHGKVSFTSTNVIDEGPTETSRSV